MELNKNFIYNFIKYTIFFPFILSFSVGVLLVIPIIWSMSFMIYGPIEANRDIKYSIISIIIDFWKPIKL